MKDIPIRICTKDLEKFQIDIRGWVQRIWFCLHFRNKPLRRPWVKEFDFNFILETSSFLTLSEFNQFLNHWLFVLVFLNFLRNSLNWLLCSTWYYRSAGYGCLSNESVFLEAEGLLLLLDLLEVRINFSIHIIKIFL